MRFRVLAFALIAALLAAAVGPLAASAATAPSTPTSSVATNSRFPASGADLNPLTNVRVSGHAASAATFDGRLDVQGFAVQNGHLVATIAVRGTLTTATGTHAVSGIVATAPATVTGTCQVLNLVLGPVNLNLLGLVVNLTGPDNGPITLNITAQQGPGLLLGNLVCAIANLLNGGGSAVSIAGLLNELLMLLHQVLGSLTFSFAASGSQLVLNLSRSGSLVATAPATVTATCPVLNLTLGPLHLNLLGLVVDLSQVNLTITAQQANGNLVGNLVCAIANLLNGPSPNLAAVARDLNLLLAILHL